ncbi:assimilatory nitrate reductase electron transfer subunit [Flavimobilis soli]|uniref:Assimilatory nitrate reductase electron transfer subunit n=1 Tax=Flavimobilis soli TaxID=442709 RepID=A0A2A9EFZ2_9MICO|nr:FAD-dependent oxidoreductase [Flavimobilis soli]PFG37140.1 assimilatory nitrate reductase electron transfer subunit [Flavimobilis soli]
MKVVVVGNGMVGSRLVAELCASSEPGAAALDITVLGAEDHLPYNRVLLSEVVAGAYDLGAIDLPGVVDPRVGVWTGVSAVAVDRDGRVVVDSIGGRHRYDALVLAAGASARVPELPGLVREDADLDGSPLPSSQRDDAGRDARPVPGPQRDATSLASNLSPGPQRHDASRDARPAPGPRGARDAGLVPGAHVLRTIDDAREIVAASANARHVVVLGAGVLGLEVAVGLAGRTGAGAVVHLVHPRGLMNAQLDAAAGEVAADAVARLGVHVRTGVGAAEVLLRDGRVAGVVLEDATVLPADLLVVTAGTVPETRLAAEAGLDVDRGVVVGPDLATPGDASVFAIGDCAQPPEGGTGLVVQGWDQARRLARHLAERAGESPKDRSAAVAGRDGGHATVPDEPRSAARHGHGEALPGGRRTAMGSEPDDRGGVFTGKFQASPSDGQGHDGVVEARPQDPEGSAAGQRPASSARASGGCTCGPVDDSSVVKVKGRGVDVVAMGVSGSARPAACAEHPRRTVRLSDPDAVRHLEVVVQAGRVVGATCVGGGAVAADLVAAFTRGTPVPRDPAQLLVRAVGPVSGGADTPVRIPDRATICRCNGVTKGDLVRAWRDGNRTVEEIARSTRATTGCSGCKAPVCGILDWLHAAEPAPDAAAERPGEAPAPAVAPSAPAPSRAG